MSATKEPRKIVINFWPSDEYAQFILGALVGFSLLIAILILACGFAAWINK